VLIWLFYSDWLWLKIIYSKLKWVYEITCPIYYLVIKGCLKEYRLFRGIPAADHQQAQPLVEVGTKNAWLQDF